MREAHPQLTLPAGVLTHVNSPKNFLLGLLALTTVGGAILAWVQYGELVELRAAAMNRDERRDWEQRLADLKKQNRDLQTRLAARAGREEPTTAAGDNAEARPRGERGERGTRPEGRGGGPEIMRQQAAAIRDLMAKPEVQAMLSAQQKAAIEARFAPLFKSLNLSAEQTQQLTALLAERGNTRRDIDEAARAQGINPRENPEAFRKLFTDAQNELNTSIKSVIGEPGFAQLQNYEQTMPQRLLVDSLQQRLAATNAPLSTAQADQLVQILAANAPQRTTPADTAGGVTVELGFGRGPDGPGFGFGGPGFGPPPGGPDLGRMLGGLMGGPGPGGPGGPPGGGPGGGGAIVTPAAVAQAQTILAPPQVEALQRIQQTQAAQQQLQQMVRDTLAATAKAAPSPGQNASDRSAPSGGNASGGSGGTTPPTKRPGGG